MADGHLNKCKDCNKGDSMKTYNSNIVDEKWKDSERKRGREKARKYKYKPSVLVAYQSTVNYRTKYPEKNLAKSRSGRLIRSFDGSEFHHWSYNDEHHKDVIELSKRDHGKAHRFIVYDQSKFMYRTLDGVLLDTKESHLSYITEKIKTEED